MEQLLTDRTARESGGRGSDHLDRLDSHNTIRRVVVLFERYV
jgi:hypothetical protein